MLTETREELAKADQKANLLLAALGVALAALAGALSSGHYDPLTSGWWAGLAFFCACGCGVAALVLFASAVMPRTGAGDSRRAHYFGDIALAVRARPLDEVRSVVEETDLVERDLSQFAILSRTVATKYRYIRLGMYLSAGFMGFVLVSAVGTALR
ncbi:F0F1-type ATP synthase membrane subunit c/vacuolar-type H+-ATPase subunit K [Kitasatospora herbaricolor]|uniref:Pycsar system effector family protein n=1 Tax=Kitasatospora herbaricolor TaxID=68217 RepID=UPI001748AD02|nr:Pycsar system effector family protein [Kitasatospora herbaricolor]MDQ0313342.1 F0F1-type ATP synthase membrane subunit c/vacuolar-type H+-ATPase subunit K [Kitasatospora herbaricolor]